MSQPRRQPVILKIRKPTAPRSAMATAPAPPLAPSLHRLPYPNFTGSQHMPHELNMADLEGNELLAAGFCSATGRIPGMECLRGPVALPPYPGHQSPPAIFSSLPLGDLSPESPPPTDTNSPSPSGMRAAASSPVGLLRPAASPQRRSPRSRPLYPGDYADTLALSFHHLPCQGDHELIDSVRQGFGGGCSPSGRLPDISNLLRAAGQARSPRPSLDAVLERFALGGDVTPADSSISQAAINPSIMAMDLIAPEDLSPLSGSIPQCAPLPKNIPSAQRDPATLVAERALYRGSPSGMDMPDALPVASPSMGSPAASSGYSDIPPPLVLRAPSVPPEEPPRQSLRLLIKRKDGELSVSPRSSPSKSAASSPVKPPEHGHAPAVVKTTPMKPSTPSAAAPVKIVTTGVAQIPVGTPSAGKPNVKVPLRPTKLIKPMEKGRPVKPLDKAKKRREPETTERPAGVVAPPPKRVKSPAPIAPVKPPAPKVGPASPAAPVAATTPPMDGKCKKGAARGKGRPPKNSISLPSESEIEQLKKLNEGVLDLTSSGSVLATARLDKIDWRTKLEMLPEAVQYELVGLMPSSWRYMDADGRLRLQAGLLGRGDTEFKKHVEEWQRNLLSGEYDTEMRRKYVEHALAMLDPWKLANFEPAYGDLLRERVGHEESVRPVAMTE